ncbi:MULTISPECIES: phosphate ABC transporter substrate-binding protein PstS [unclassified Streptomyces]|uniref:phosphate ABC transporter substrate-binding protein PstS n=1 Tax=unclassified Streptomyces TaxID=2593676 RepID=UPI0022B6B386|nr:MULTISPECIES: phosphate ABC transporter substrate-binding protein PstS [unclassified Streptomyces]MCZ7417466.1 phosphate ABC transporter substrate-binding protein PstS [Streptomyces sp. WMMC897]MCZ7432706.1 phosphate ABC transporter substrate-binding protein PstS [Streptomyces sp. WMMC1477]
MKLQRTNRLRALTVGAMAVTSALVLTACGSDDNSSQGGDSPSKKAEAGNIECKGEGNLLASGSSAQKNAVDAWVQAYQQACESTKVNYNPTGSGAGIQEFLQGKTAFAGSDSALDADEVEASKEVCTDGKAINLPMVGGPVAVGYNLSGVEDLVLDADTIAKIFDSKITKWDDEAIKKLNPDTDLPSTKIQAFHRSDESGTTDNFTTYLQQAAPDSWTYEPAKAWAAQGGQSANGSAGVATNVKQTDGAIGYFELSYATGNDIDTVKLDTGAGEPVEATVENSSNGIAAGKIVGTDGDLAMELDYATKEAGAYPIILVTYEIACDKGNDPSTLEAMKSFLTYAASEDGQNQLAEIGYAPIPDDVITKVREQVSSLS